MPHALPRWRRLFVSLSLTLLTVIQLGCDGRPKRVPVSGQVLIDGKPVTAGFIRVVPDNARAASSSIGPDGRFTLTTFEDNDGCVIGTHRVIVSAFEQTGGGTRWLAPKRYRDLSSTDLTATIDGPTDSLIINLTWEGDDVVDEPERPQDMTGDVDPSELE